MRALYDKDRAELDFLSLTRLRIDNLFEGLCQNLVHGAPRTEVWNIVLPVENSWLDPQRSHQFLNGFRVNVISDLCVR